MIAFMLCTFGCTARRTFVSCGNGLFTDLDLFCSCRYLDIVVVIAGIVFTVSFRTGWNVVKTKAVVHLKSPNGYAIFTTFNGTVNMTTVTESVFFPFVCCLGFIDGFCFGNCNPVMCMNGCCRWSGCGFDLFSSCLGRRLCSCCVV